MKGVQFLSYTGLIRKGVMSKIGPHESFQTFTESLFVKINKN